MRTSYTPIMGPMQLAYAVIPVAGKTFNVNGETYTWGAVSAGKTIAIGANLAAAMDNLVAWANVLANGFNFRCVRKQLGAAPAGLQGVIIIPLSGSSLTVSSSDPNATITAVSYFKIGGDPVLGLAAVYLPLQFDSLVYQVVLGAGSDETWAGNVSILFGTGVNNQEISVASPVAAYKADIPAAGGTGAMIPSATKPLSGAYLKFVASVAAMSVTVCVFAEAAPYHV